MIHTISKEVIITTHQKEQMKYLQMTFQKKFLIVAIISACVITFSNAQCTASLRNLVAKHEGDKLCVYVDTTGHKTIGIGYNLDQGGAKEMIDP